MYWKTYLGNCIHRTSDISVFQNPMYRWLTFNSDAIQTLVHRRQYQRMELAYIRVLTLLARLNPGPTCLLGLGGGSVLQALEPVFGTIPRVAVEKSDEMIAVAKTFFGLNELSHLTIYPQDAAFFVAEHSKTYDHVLVDLYTQNQFPTQCHTVEFFQHCKRLLNPGGVLAVNLANPTEQYNIYQTLLTCFPHQIVALPVKKTTNLILLAYHGIHFQSFLQLLSPSFFTLRWTPRWGYIGI